MTKTCLSALLGVMMGCCIALRAGAQDEITAVPNRPTVANTADTVQSGVFEVEAGTDLATTHKDLNLFWKFGLTKNLELELADDPVIADSAALTIGTGDVNLGFKYRFLPKLKSRPTLSVVYSAKLPTAAGDLGSGEVDHNATFLASKDFGKHHFDFNTGMNFFGRADRGGFDSTWANSLSWSHPLRGKWSVSGELSGYTRQNSSTPAEMQTLAALGYNLKPRLVLDAAIAGRIFGDVPEATFLAGFTYSIADLYHHHKPAPKR